MKIKATNTIKVNGKSYAPGTNFEVDDEIGQEIVDIKAGVNLEAVIEESEGEANTMVEITEDDVNAMDYDTLKATVGELDLSTDDMKTETLKSALIMWIEADED